MRRISFLMFVVFAWLVSAPCLHAQGEITIFDVDANGGAHGFVTIPPHWRGESVKVYESQV